MSKRAFKTYLTFRDRHDRCIAGQNAMVKVARCVVQLNSDMLQSKIDSGRGAANKPSMQAGHSERVRPF